MCHVSPCRRVWYRGTSRIFALIRSPRVIKQNALARECCCEREMIAEPSRAEPSCRWQLENLSTETWRVAQCRSGKSYFSIELARNPLSQFPSFILEIKYFFETIDIARACPRGAAHHWTNLLDKGRYSRATTLSLVLDDLNRASAVSPDNHNRLAVRCQIVLHDTCILRFATDLNFLTRPQFASCDSFKFIIILCTSSRIFSIYAREKEKGGGEIGKEKERQKEWVTRRGEYFLNVSKLLRILLLLYYIDFYLILFWLLFLPHNLRLSEILIITIYKES